MTAKKLGVLKALINSNSLSEASEKAGISRKTLYTYIEHDSAFSDAYLSMINRMYAAMLDDIWNKRDKALDIVSRILEDENEKSADRLRAAQIIFSAFDGVMSKSVESVEKLISDNITREVLRNDDLPKK